MSVMNTERELTFEEELARLSNIQHYLETKYEELLPKNLIEDSDYEEGCFITLLEELNDLRSEKQEKYGAAWRMWKPESLICRMTDKIWRLKNLTEHGLPADKVKENCFDLINFALMLSIMCIEEEKGGTGGWKKPKQYWKETSSQ